ncbi:phage tail terminator protein [Brucella anthropi]|uniref:phage tail terminator protein n=1 Tax=Brucella anthropi TaxID=529 RepID=UPI0005B7F70D|nr:hypothetical protein [Brucella anthropi]KIU69121.1 hypothetical protein TR92_07545 [Brucella anthropi]
MLQEIIDRLIANAPILTAVLPAEDIDALSQGVAPRSGTAFVLPYRKRGSPNELAAGGFRQLVAVQFLTAFVVRKHDDQAGGKKVAMFDEYEDAIERTLAGWQPPSCEDPIEFVASQPAPLRNGVTLYVQTWETSRFLEGTS